MDIRVVETLPTAGSLADTAFAINSNIENISLDYDYTNKDLALLDINLNYTALPWQLTTDMVKKVFLTYNGISTETRQLIQTVVMESGSGPDPTGKQLPGFNNSNEWIYKPSEFQLPGPFPTTSNPLDTATFPYDQSQGITVVKQFLGGESGNVQNDYTAFYRLPTQHSFQLANANDSKIFTDGWYTSYTIACKNWNVVDPSVKGITAGQIVYYTPEEEFYINLTGTSDTSPDTTNWKKAPSFVEWMDFLRNNMGTAMTNDPVYFVENQHLVTPDLAQALKQELLKVSCACDKKDFGMPAIETWMKLTQKRIGAFIKFNEEVFKTAQEIIETTRKDCYLCLYHNKEKLC